MTPPVDYSQNTDPSRLVREGTSQEQRLSPALDPSYAAINERKPEHWIIFAQAYSRYLKYFDSNNVEDGNWAPFFSKNVSLFLATTAAQDVNYYKSKIKETFNFLNNRENPEDELKNHLGYLFSYAGTIASQLNAMKEALPNETSLESVAALKKELQNLIKSQLAPVYRRLIAYYKADLNQTALQRLIADSRPEVAILGNRAVTFSATMGGRFTTDWITDDSASWSKYLEAIKADSSVYGSGNIFERINHISTHNLFTSIFDQFLKTYSRVVNESQRVLQTVFDWNGHEPHYALFLAFLKLLEHARGEVNTLTKRHLNFYYRDVLRLKEKAVEPNHAHLIVELARLADPYQLKTGELFKAGKDDRGIEVFFGNDRDFVANQAKIASLKTIYRHKDVPNDSLLFQNNRVFASQVSNSDDGMGSELTSVDQSWHPFFNKIHADSKLVQINMPQAKMGFAIASHYLWMAEGLRTVTVNFKVAPSDADLTADFSKEIICFFTSEDGWIEKTALEFKIDPESQAPHLNLRIELSGADPAISAYFPDVHGYNFSTNLPILLVKLRHQDNHDYPYHFLQDIAIETIVLTGKVSGLKSLAVSNDFGPIDTSKPFQPFGASPTAKSALDIGSKEAFQKELDSATVNMTWQNTPAPYNNKTVNINIQYLQSGEWKDSDIPAKSILQEAILLSFEENKAPFVNLPDFSELEYYSTSSKFGFIRLETSTDFGQSEYEQALIDYIKKVIDDNLSDGEKKPEPPVGPFVKALTLNYTSKPQTIILNSTNKSVFEARQSYFFHLAPFGQAEQHPYLKTGIPNTENHIVDQAIYLFPALKHLNTTDSKHPKGDSVQHEAEFYIGLIGIKPPQSVALLFQIADGTANPLSNKPDPHIHWSYLYANEWLTFAKNEVEDLTNGLIDSGIITFAVPRNASADNTLLPSGMHWIRAAVETESDAVCRLLGVAAQALQVTFINKANDPAFSAKVLPAGTISKLDQPNANIKQINQPFPTFGGRGEEHPEDFFTRISERLRHKDRGIVLWDYERLVLEAFPQIYKVKCLNHTNYGADDEGRPIYDELAPGHITVITLPSQRFRNQRDPLKPYTSLKHLKEIEAFLSKRMSCFITLHVKNPQLEEVNVTCKVRLQNDGDSSYYSKKVQEAITHFLSPWAFSSDIGPSFGGRVNKSSLINFMEDLPYVDYVTDFQLFHSVMVNGKKEIKEKSEIEGTRAISMLVSAPKHEIIIISAAEEELSQEAYRSEL